MGQARSSGEVRKSSLKPSTRLKVREIGAVKGVVIMTNRKAVLGIMAVLACAAIIIGALLAFDIIDQDYQCGTKSLERAKKTHEVFQEYKSLFYRYPHRRNVNTEFLRDEETGLRTETWGIVIVVAEKVDEDTVPPERRIPGSLEGVPVQIIPAEIVYKAEDFQRNLPSENNPHTDLAYDVREKNRDLFRRNPFYQGNRFILYEPGGEPGNRLAIIELKMYEKVHQLDLSPTVRIPDCLEDVPVKLIAPSD